MGCILQPVFVMSPVLPSDNAKKICLKLMEWLDYSPFHECLTSGENNGKLFGVLVTTDGTVYKAFSGSLAGSYVHDGFVNPVFSPEKLFEIEKKFDVQIKTQESKEKKRELCLACWKEIMRIHVFNTWNGNCVTLDEIYPNAPSGTGDCCAPKLLNQCYKDGKKPKEMAEFFYGSGKTHFNKSFCTPCDSRCHGILKHIIGLDVVYLDNDIVVVNKPSGILAIEGRGADKQDCIASRVRNLYNTIKQPCIHRLDQATSGLMVLGITKRAHDKLSLDFEERRVNKEYQALVHGKIIEKSIFTTKQRLDTSNRPLQICDIENGKEAITEIIPLGYNHKNDVSRVTLIPHTGRTHQLRLACSLMGHSILNDPLYGISGEDRLMLEACKLEFNHPVTNEYMSFTIPVDF